MTPCYLFSCVVFMLTQRIHPMTAALSHPSGSGVLSHSHLCPFPLCRVPAFLMPCVTRTQTAWKGRPWWLAMVRAVSLSGSGVLQRPQPGYIPQISDCREHQGLSFLPSLLLRSLPCLQLCGGWAREPQAAQRHNKRCLFQLRGPFTAGRREKILYFHVPCRQGEEVTAGCDLFCAVCLQGLRLAVV